MLRHQLIHPKINEVLGRAGHHSIILIADGNYPAWNKRGPQAELVSLNLRPGLVTVSEVLTVLLTAIVVQQINTMGVVADDPYALEGDPPVWAEYRSIIREANLDLPLTPLPKWDFYQAVNSPDHILTIQTGDLSLWANLMLTIGCRTDR